MEFTCVPYVDPDIKLLIEKMNPPRVSIDNESCRDCTLVKVDSANKHGMLLEMVQVLTDLDLVISKSYISSDGGWLMDVFHVTDQMGNKITDESLINYIQQAITSSRENSSVAQSYVYKERRPRHVSTDLTALEMIGIDKPGLMSEMSAVLAELGCCVSAAVAWTHNRRAACIIYVEDEEKAGPITDPSRVAYVKEQLENVVEAHHCQGERRSVRLAPPVTGRTHTERRLHQLMASAGDYEEGSPCCNSDSDDEEILYWSGKKKRCYGTHVTLEKCGEKDYSIVTVTSRDRPKLLFDTVCALTDMNYVIFHAAVRSKGSRAIQEYYIRHKDGHTPGSEEERRRFVQCLTAATERRISCGVRLDIQTENRIGLLSDITRVFRENGLSIARAEIGTSGDKAIGTFYVKDTSGQNVNPKTLEMVKQEIGEINVAVNSSPDFSPETTSPTRSRDTFGDKADRPWFSFGSMFWTQLEKVLKQFQP